MTPFRARLTLLAISALFVGTAGNALFLQERTRLLPSSNVSVTQFLLEKPLPLAEKTAAPPASAPAPSDTQGRDLRLRVALQRELARKGYAEQLQSTPNGLNLAVLVYEFDNGLPLTGQPTEAILKQVLFDQNQGPQGSFADRAEVNAKLVIEVQKALTGLGFFRGTFSGRIDIWTANAIKDFERHRGIAQTGRLNEATLLELIAYLGQPLLLSSG